MTHNESLEFLNINWAYERPTNRSPLSKAEKLSLLKEYIQYYRQLAATDATVLNRKIPREAFDDLLDQLGEMLLTESVVRHIRNKLTHTLQHCCGRSETRGITNACLFVTKKFHQTMALIVSGRTHSHIHHAKDAFAQRTPGLRHRDARTLKAIHHVRGNRVGDRTK